jgi:ribosomal protein S18 acetylase RimI-like enzyme
VNHILLNPVYHALTSGDANKSNGTDHVRYFDEAVSPFVGFHETYMNGFDELYELLPTKRKILYASPHFFIQPQSWRLIQKIEGVQMVYDAKVCEVKEVNGLSPLNDSHIQQMVELARLTKPGPFGERTISFGSYYGFFDNDRLIAMTGQRLHPHEYSEISAVCTHPEHLGKGYAFALVQHQTNLILQQGKIPFLHVRADNARAINLYERIGFKISRPMNFYFMEKG